MNQDIPAHRPAWVSDEMFPFQSKFYTTPSGHKMHYVDEGEGKAIVFVHGNPSWSFEYRHLIRAMRPLFRCIAPDHVGFGLSSRGTRPEEHHPAAHAKTFAAFINSLGIQDITLFLSDWGGPIGLDFARKNPELVSRVVIANTWCWPVSRDMHFKMFSFMMSSWLGQYLIKRHNFFVNQVVPRAVGRKGVLTPEVMKHYRNAQPTLVGRKESAALPGAIVGASDWLQDIWEDRKAFTRLPTLVLWGAKDIAFRRKELAHWQSELTDCEVHVFEDCGHFLAEEAPEELVPLLKEFVLTH